jgi:hypothetical protein
MDLYQLNLNDNFILSSSQIFGEVPNQNLKFISGTRMELTNCQAMQHDVQVMFVLISWNWLLIVN